MAGDEEVVVVEDEDVDATRALELDHLGGDVVDLAHAVALAGEALLVPRGDAAKGAVGVTPAARHERRDAVAEARRRLAPPVGARQRREIGEGRVPRRHDGLPVAIREASDGNEWCAVLHRRNQRDHRVFGLLLDDRVDLREIHEDVLRRERPEVPADGDVPLVARLT